MAKLTYWFAECFNDDPCYSVVAKTKREAQIQREQRIGQGSSLGPVVKRTIVYKDAFDLMDALTSEDGGRGYSNS